jgi:hypothetical protein
MKTGALKAGVTVKTGVSRHAAQRGMTTDTGFPDLSRP